MLWRETYRFGCSRSVGGCLPALSLLLGQGAPPLGNLFGDARSAAQGELGVGVSVGVGVGVGRGMCSFVLGLGFGAGAHCVAWYGLGLALRWDGGRVCVGWGTERGRDRVGDG